jgi:hypothetical protein
MSQQYPGKAYSLREFLVFPAPLAGPELVR